MIIVGLRHYGVTEEVPGVGYVTTAFAHVMFLPLLPLWSVLVTAEDGDTLRGIRLFPPSWRSILVVWCRLFAVVGSLFVLLHMCWAGIAFNDLYGDLSWAMRDPEQMERLVTDLSTWGLAFYAWQLAVVLGGPCTLVLAPVLFLAPARWFRVAGPRRAAALREALAAERA